MPEPKPAGLGMSESDRQTLLSVVRQVHQGIVELTKNEAFLRYLRSIERIPPEPDQMELFREAERSFYLMRADLALARPEEDTS